MIVILIPIATIAFVALYLTHLQRSVRRHNDESWDSLVARLRPDWIAGPQGAAVLTSLEADATPQERWQSIQGAQGLWTMYQNASVMMKLADFAARHCESVDRVLLESLRSDAIQIRLCVLTALARYTFSQVNDGICVNAFRAAALYCGMTARLKGLVDATSNAMAPSFAGASC
jgi:hypothetical protein